MAIKCVECGEENPTPKRKTCSGECLSKHMSKVARRGRDNSPWGRGGNNYFFQKRR